MLDNRSWRPEMTRWPTTNWVGSNSRVEKNCTFGSAASFGKRACWNESFSGYVRVEMWTESPSECSSAMSSRARFVLPVPASPFTRRRSEEHTSELQSQSNLVCRLLLEKKKQLGRS